MPRITREPLTRKAVESAKATGKAYRMRDATVPGLVLRVSAAGSKSWAVVWGRGQEKAFGDFPHVTLDGARDVARRLLGEIAEHGAPLAVIEAAKPKPLTLGDFIGEHYAPWALANQKAGQATVEAIGVVFGDLYDRELVKLGLSLPLVPFGQGFKDMAPALDALEAALLNKRIAHGGHPVLSNNAANATATQDPAGNRKLDKMRSTGRIDGMVALAMAMGAAQTAEAPTPDPYKERGLIFL